MEESERVATFSLLGGPLHGLGRRIGLVRDRVGTVPLGIALGLGPWLVLVAIALITGAGEGIFSLAVIAGHVRLLVAIPLFFVCESWVDPRMTAFVRTMVGEGVVPEKSVPALNSEIERILRLRDSWIPEALCVVGTVLLSLNPTHLPLGGTTRTFDLSQPTGVMPPIGQWYWFACLPLFRFLALRWVWRLLLWSYLLLQIARLELHLVPTHPDGSGGLGYLEVVQIHFVPLIFALSALQAASCAEEIVAGMTQFEAVYPGLALLLVVDAVLFLGPLLLFTPKLWACRVKGLSDYMQFASSYVSGFDRKWLRPETAPTESLLGTSDLQSLADLSNSMNVVRNMRVVPVRLGMLRDFAIVVLLPVLPLLLLKYPVAELAQKLVARIGF